MQSNNILLLEDIVLYVYDSEIESDVELISSLTGATIVDQLVPFLTTHVVCLKETPQLKAGIARMFSLNKAGASSQKSAITTDSNLVELVTIDWLKACLLSQSVVPTIQFKPIAEKVQVDTNKRLQQTYTMKRDLFGQMTFAILSSTFYDKEGDTAIELVEMTRRQIIENGGRVLDDDQKSNYVIADDGYR